MNYSKSFLETCHSESPAQKVSQLWFILQCIALLTLNLVTLSGNFMVILAVILNKHLRSTTNLFIVSLACADLAVGFFVLPFSTATELFRFWLFGETWCKAWLAMDVWLCTSSIYNLLAITIDRYMAVTKPLSYRFVITKKRATAIIISVWVSSFLICFPFVIFQWIGAGINKSWATTTAAENLGESFSTEPINHEEDCFCTQMDNSPGYIFYSAMGSFYIPMVVICYFYFRIYCTVRKVANSAQSGLVSMTLVTNPAVMFTAEVCAKAMVKKSQDEEQQQQEDQKNKVTKQYSSTLRVHRGGYKPVKKITQNLLRCDDQSPDLRKLSDSTAPNSSPCNNNRPQLMGFSPRQQALLLLQQNNRNNLLQQQNNKPPAAKNDTSKLANYGKRYQRKLSIELKALKIVGIVTGCFMASWIGFCVVYSMQALPWCRQEHCVSQIAVSVVIWLGYANSALNPFIYAACNQYYRSTFKRIIKCTCCRFSKWERQKRQERAVAILCRQAGACMLVVHNNSQEKKNENEEEQQRQEDEKKIDEKEEKENQNKIELECMLKLNEIEVAVNNGSTAL
uniref:G-protein coupled receptors family 1 profile domain-containing protein n=1 Tax=Romanomermis culicivorax TaxID=13658 RepID=A0A915KFW3_ROMCU